MPTMDEKESTRELIVVDVKRYKKVKEALEASEKRYRQLFENSPLGIFRTTPAGRIIDANPALVAMMGFGSFAEMASFNLEHDYPDTRNSRTDFIKNLERSGEVKGLETVWRKKDGSRFHIRENAKLIEGEDGQLLYEGTVEDITSSKEAEEAQKKRAGQIEILNRIITSGNQAESLAEMLEIIVESLVTPLTFDTAGIFMYDHETKKISMVARHGKQNQFIQDKKYMSIENLPFSRVLGQGLPIFLDEAQKNQPDFFKKWGWRMACGVPLLSKGRVIGALNLASCARSDFSPDEKNILELIGKETGTLISKLQTEAALHASEKYYRTLIETSPDIIVVMDLEAKLLTVNQQLLKSGGYFYDEVIGVKAFHFIAGFKHGFLEKKTLDFINSKEVSGSEYLFRKKNGQTIPLEVAASLLYDEAGQPMGIIAIGRDVSERKRAEEQLRFLGSITENTSDSITVTDVDYSITYINKVAEKFFGYTLEELKGKTPKIFNADPDAEQSQKKIYKAVAGGKTYMGESLNRRKDGSTFYCEYKVMPLMNDSGKIYAYSAVQRDISERKETEVKLLAYQEQLRALTSELTLVEEKERRRIATELHDQIGQNLILCKLKVAALEKEVAGDSVKAELSTVRRLLECSIQDARALIFDLSPPVLYEIDLPAALEWLAERIHEQYHIPVEFENRSGDMVLEVDRQVLLFQVVREMLVNMGKHSRAGQAKVILALEGHSIKIQVNDDGVGFDAARIFDPKDRSGGFGFFSVRERLNFLGGALEVKSRAGQGTQITLTIPQKVKSAKDRKENS
jgi:PAS domain S-box-containing protein